MPVQDGETLVYDQATAMWINAWGVEYDNPRLVYKMYTDFFSSAADSNDPWVGAPVGAIGSKFSSPATADHPGIIGFNSGADANSGYRFMTAVNCILIAGAEHSEFIFRTPAAFTDVYARLGFQDSIVHTAPTDGVYLNQAGDTLTGKTRSNGAESTTATHHHLAANTWYRAKIAVNGDADLATFFLYNEAGQQLWSDTLAANIPTATGRETGHGVVAWKSTPEGESLIELDMMIGTRAGYITR